MIRRSRRQVLAQLATTITLSLSGCARSLSVARAFPQPRSPALIDAHCHLFNITDLPASSFIRIVFLKKYETQGEPTPSLLKLKKRLDRIQEILSVGVTTAEDEASSGRGDSLIPDGTPPLPANARRELRREQAEAEKILGEMSPPEQLLECDDGPGTQFSLDTIIDWFLSFRSSRKHLTKKLAGAHELSGYSVSMLCPALVDYSNWLEQELNSTLRSQVEAMGVIAANAKLPPTHGYVAFDPLRAALVRRKLPVTDGEWDPLDLVRDALNKHGFLGVKLYPPMGFRASGNANSGDVYPPHVERAFRPAYDPGTELDLSLDELWRVCLENDAPILAHAADSVAAGEHYGRRADPSFWLPVASKYPKLRVLLAHFGRFRNAANGHPIPACSDDLPFEDSWEAVVGRHVHEHPDSYLYADVSYLSGLFHPEERERAHRGMLEYLKLDPGARHLVFGSDWVMIGIERGYMSAGGYAHRIAGFLAECGLNADEVEGVMRRNAMRLFGLDTDSNARRRLLEFYRLNELSSRRLPQ